MSSVWGAIRQPDGIFSVLITRPGKSCEVLARQVVLATGDLSPCRRSRAGRYRGS